jgi:hypothetical protein
VCEDEGESESVCVCLWGGGGEEEEEEEEGGGRREHVHVFTIVVHSTVDRASVRCSQADARNAMRLCDG